MTIGMKREKREFSLKADKRCPLYPCTSVPLIVQLDTPALQVDTAAFASVFLVPAMSPVRPPESVVPLFLLAFQSRWNRSFPPCSNWRIEDRAAHSYRKNEPCVFQCSSVPEES